MDDGRHGSARDGTGGSRSNRSNYGAAGGGAAGGGAAGSELRRLRAELAAAKAREEDLRASAEYVVQVLNADVPGSGTASRLLQVPARVRRLIRHGMRCATIVAVAMAESHTDADSSGITGFTTDNPLHTFDLEAFEPTADAVEGLVPVDAIINEQA